MLVVVRHGRTNFNENGDGKEKLRGWKDLPLSTDGKNDITDTAKELKKLKLPVDKHYTSSLRRAVQSSDIIGDELDANFEKTDKLKDWNVGEYTGKDVMDTLDEIHGYLDKPSEKIPGGESYQQFYNRVTPFLKSLVESDEGNMVVTHNRVVTLIKALAANKGDKPVKSILKKKGPIEPGGILMIDPDWKMTIIHNHGNSQS